MPRLKRLNKRFGRLVARVWIKESQSWRCMCDCGKEKVVKNAQLGWGVNSCGCLKRDEFLRRGGGPKAMRLNEIARYYRRNAVVRKLAWGLSKEEFESIVTKQCHYCGDKDSLGSGFTGIDRVDNALGYSISNCVPCCKTCNLAKHYMSLKEFIQWVQRVHANLRNGGTISA